MNARMAMRGLARAAVVSAVAATLAACASAGDPGDTGPQTTSNPVRGASAVSQAGGKAIGAYGAIGTSDDVRGRTSGSGASVLTGRANQAGTDSGTRAETTSEPPPPPPR